MTIKYRIKQVYGNEKLYVVDQEQANAWYRLTGKLTITQTDLNVLYNTFEIGSEQVI